ncbi:hypothetical protein AMEX_G24885 [Astyanax mexicanus]|uniref:Uncharacterized protein n=1 Tax=Astyanax mexicanus TaxID=7994 RepID=A0A8T2KNW1_ASTMX|nr:hypothetical protein AMEX_G24885 [Astyanax mexicanus]
MPVLLDGVPPKRSEQASLAGVHERYCYDRWHSDQLQNQMQQVPENFACRLPSESRMKTWIEKKGVVCKHS